MPDPIIRAAQPPFLHLLGNRPEQGTRFAGQVAYILTLALFGHQAGIRGGSTQ